MNRHDLPSYPGPLVLRASITWRNLGLLLGCLLFTAGGLWLWSDADDPDSRYSPTDTRAVAVLCIVMFGAGAAWLLWQLVRRRTVLVLDADGLHDQGLGTVSSGYVPWSEVTGVEVHTQVVPVVGTYRRRPMQFPWVRVFVRDPDAVIAHAPESHQSTLRANCRMGTPATPVWLNCEMLRTDPATLASMVDEYLRAYHAAHPAPLQ